MQQHEHGTVGHMVADLMGAFGHEITPQQLKHWLRECAPYSVDELRRAFTKLKAEGGRYAPRPVDVSQRIARSHGDDGRCPVPTAFGRCGKPGVWSDSTNGGGPWLCRAHASGPRTTATPLPDTLRDFMPTLDRRA